MPELGSYPAFLEDSLMNYNDIVGAIDEAKKLGDISFPKYDILGMAGEAIRQDGKTFSSIYLENLTLEAIKGIAVGALGAVAFGVLASYVVLPDFRKEVNAQLSAAYDMTMERIF